MAAETTDYSAALAFLARSRAEAGAVVPSEGVGHLPGAMPDLDLGWTLRPGEPSESAGIRAFVTGWTKWEGVMLLAPEREFAADLRVALAARSERALRDLLLAFPYGKVGVFQCWAAWMGYALEELLEGRRLPTSEGAATADASAAALYLGFKRGSHRTLPTDVFHRPQAAIREQGGAQRPGAGGQLTTSKHPILAQFAELAHAAGRQRRAQFVAEGVTLVQRALDDGLPVEALLCTPGLLRAPEGADLIQNARQAGIPHYQVTDGLMGKVTTTRPVPTVAAAICARLREAETFHIAPGTALLIAENINNPDNLGMILRTADAAGAEGVLVAGEGADPFHKNCVRAARGAVGRLPLLSCRSLETYLRGLHAAGVTVVGAALEAEWELYRCALKPPIAVVVGNEQEGISRPVLEACSHRVRIPMAPGQDSLNVGVAAGVMLYEVFRQKIAPGRERPV
ncbi:MAG TPA: RNA methyltransferase [Chthonomonadaceae bacterium]|nr:RNA methyltransferase [Chthonomonadaceae bacterium]